MMTFDFSLTRFFMIALFLGGMNALGVYAASDSRLQCSNNIDDKERLACYDAYAAGSTEVGASIEPDEALHRSYLTRSWDLDGRDDALLGEKQSPLRPHRVSYVIVRRTSQPNIYPYSPTHASTVASNDTDQNEIKFQISQKAKVLNRYSMNFMGFTAVRLWGAYTQQSDWQAFNAGNSSPFRETNYEPELIATFSTGNEYGLKLVNLGMVHQSNGRDLSFSRSWNRVYLQGGWENETWSGLLRTWWRAPEDISQDDNPDMEDYIGRAEIVVRWQPLDGSQLLGVTIRNNLRSNPNRGFMQLDWGTPVTLSKSAKLHIQITSGYGESLIDYNYQQTTMGLGVSFRDW